MIFHNSDTSFSSNLIHPLAITVTILVKYLNTYYYILYRQILNTKFSNEIFS